MIRSFDDGNRIIKLFEWKDSHGPQKRRNSGIYEQGIKRKYETRYTDIGKDR